jgi:hypothetical protein
LQTLRSDTAQTACTQHTAHCTLHCSPTCPAAPSHPHNHPMSTPSHTPPLTHHPHRRRQQDRGWLSLQHPGQRDHPRGTQHR